MPTNEKIKKIQQLIVNYKELGCHIESIPEDGQISWFFRFCNMGQDVPHEIKPKLSGMTKDDGIWILFAMRALCMFPQDNQYDVYRNQFEWLWDHSPRT